MKSAPAGTRMTCRSVAIGSIACVRAGAAALGQGLAPARSRRATERLAEREIRLRHIHERMVKRENWLRRIHRHTVGATSGNNSCRPTVGRL